MMAANNYFGFTHGGTQYGAATASAAYGGQTGYAVAPAATAATYGTQRAAATGYDTAYQAAAATQAAAHAHAQAAAAAASAYDASKSAYYQQAYPAPPQQPAYDAAKPAYTTPATYAQVTTTAYAAHTAHSAHTAPVSYQVQGGARAGGGAKAYGSVYTATTAATSYPTQPYTAPAAQPAKPLYNATMYVAQQAKTGGGGGWKNYNKGGVGAGQSRRPKPPPKAQQLHYCDVCRISCAGPQDDEDAKDSGTLLEPGKDILYRVRFYRPFMCGKERNNSRHSVFTCDVVASGRSALAALRERIVCANDVDVRIDVSARPAALPHTTAKELFPSGFMFINNVFYVDAREGCVDYSEPIRAWALRRGMGDFPVRDMHAVRLRDLVLRLGHPEVYVHQGNCEHLFTFSEVRLVGPGERVPARQLPRHCAVLQHQTVYCNTCAEFGAKWVVARCARVPFDPAFFCDTCFTLYLYTDGEKVGDFKAYSYRGNEINTLKPLG